MAAGVLLDIHVWVPLRFSETGVQDARKEIASMNSNPRFRSLTLLTTAAGLAIALSFVAFRAEADQWDKKTILTVNQPIQVRDTYLQPGTYVFKLMDSSSNRHIVQIFNSDQSRIIDTILAIPNYRLQPTGNSRFVFWETPPGTAKALRAWFYPGDNTGQEFTYPKHLRQLEIASTATVTKQTVTQQSELTTATPQPEPQPEPAPVAAPPPPAPVEQPREIAQATPPPQPAPVATEPTPAPAAVELPKTASPFTPIGLLGISLLGLYGLVQFKKAS